MRAMIRFSVALSGNVGAKPRQILTSPRVVEKVLDPMRGAGYSASVEKAVNV